MERKGEKGSERYYELVVFKKKRKEEVTFLAARFGGSRKIWRISERHSGRRRERLKRKGREETKEKETIKQLLTATLSRKTEYRRK